jgi:hypothetical protein
VFEKVSLRARAAHNHISIARAAGFPDNSQQSATIRALKKAFRLFIEFSGGSRYRYSAFHLSFITSHFAPVTHRLQLSTQHSTLDTLLPHFSF